MRSKRDSTADGVKISKTAVYVPSVTRFYIAGVMLYCRSLGIAVLSRKKHIPRDYLEAASPTNRIALLQGLMDADGSVSGERNRLTYHTTSPEPRRGRA